jgi:hypothetical protein
MSNDVLNSLNSQVIQAMDKSGITLDRLMDQLSDELQATEEKPFYDKKEKEVVYSKPLVAHDVRQRARIDAHKLRGDYPAPGLDIKSTGEHTVVIRKFGDEPDSE